MKKVTSLFLLLFLTTNHCHAAVWKKLHENNTSTLTIDKQSVLQKDLLKRAWLKIEYKSPQKNLESPEKEYNLSKVLWFFDCPSQKSATSQVFQYMNDELIYSAGIDVKSAEFIEPVPETDVDIAMRYVCTLDKPAMDKPNADKPSTNKPTADIASAAMEKKVVAPVAPVKNVTKPEARPAAIAKQPAPAKAASKISINNNAHKIHWSYEGKAGPENWGKLKADFASCDIGRNQSPVNIESTVHASLKPLKVVHRFPAKEIFNNGHTVQANFKSGNVLILDNVAFQMIQVHFHTPSENTINGKSYPLEAHFVHADAKGNLAVIAVMFAEGQENDALEKLWSQMPSEESEPTPLRRKVTPNELMPENRSYYRFSGSLTTPPCSEGVRWLLMKSSLTVSKAQIIAFEHAVHHKNNRPVQALNGRLILE